MKAKKRDKIKTAEKEPSPEQRANRMLAVLQKLGRKSPPSVVNEEEEYGLTPPPPTSRRYLKRR